MRPILLIAIPILEGLGLLAFAYLSSMSEPGFRYFPLAAVAAVIIMLFAREARLMSPKQIVMATLMLSCFAVAAFQMLGLVFPGFAKDVDTISVGNIKRLLVVLFLAIAAHGSLFAIFHILRRR